MKLRLLIAAILGVAMLGVAALLLVSRDGPVADPTGELRREAMGRFLADPSPETLVPLLRLNGDLTRDLDVVVNAYHDRWDEDSDSYEIESAGKTYIAVVARKSSGSQPPGIFSQLFGDSEWLRSFSVAFFFNPDGTLEGRVGGEVGDDGINGDNINLTTLGTGDRWFARASRSETNGPFTYRSQVHLIEPGIPRAFTLHHFSNSLAWTHEPKEEGCYFLPHGLPDEGEVPLGEATARQLALVWDAEEKLFRGPQRATYGDQPAFAVEPDQSERFAPTDPPQVELEASADRQRDDDGLPEFDVD